MSLYPMMKDLIAAFPDHLEEGLRIAKRAKWKNPAKRFKAVVITGLGGSGIGGSLAAEWMMASSHTPIFVNKDYYLPAFVDENTLVIASSYSGNTEETLSALEQALERKAEVAIITSGGRALELATENQLNSFVVEGGNPPRSMLGYSITGLMSFLDFYGLQTPDYIASWKEAIEAMRNDIDSIHAQAKVYAEQIKNHCAVVYCTDGLAAMGERLRQQLNENSKMLGWSSAIPEMNHNELVGWAGGNESFGVIILRSDFEYDRNAIRADINKDILLKRTSTVLEWKAPGSSLISQSLYLNHLGDWVSYYLSEIHQVDIMDIKVIDFLKSELGKIG